MKKFLLTLVALPLYAGASCQDEIKSDKYILFIDTNDSAREIETAEKAACKRGEKMVIVPKDYKEYHAIIEKVEAAKLEVKRCAKKHGDKAYEKCEQSRVNFNDTYNKLSAFQSQKAPIEQQVENTLKDIQTNKGKMSNVIISGHDGGGSFNGMKGHFDRNQLGKMIGKYKDINEVKSLMLLGCYTGVQKEIIEWKNIFPDVKLISGYDDSAPLSDKPFGHQYISEILTKEKEMIANADQEKLKQFTKANIKSLGQLNAAVYVNCEESGGQEYYYTSKNRAQGFSTYGAKECGAKAKEFEAIIANMGDYTSGEKEPPADTARGELRQIYIQARNLEHCSEFLGKQLDVNAIFNLLFYEGVKQSFTAFYKTDLEEAEKAIQELIAKFPNAMNGVWVPTAANLAKYSRKELLANINKIHGVLAGTDGPDTQQKRVLSWVKTVSETHLQYFQNPFSWHEYGSGIPERPTRVVSLANHRYAGGAGYGLGGGMVSGSLGGGSLSIPPREAGDQERSLLDRLLGR